MQRIAESLDGVANFFGGLAVGLVIAAGAAWYCLEFTPKPIIALQEVTESPFPIEWVPWITGGAAVIASTITIVILLVRWAVWPHWYTSPSPQKQQTTDDRHTDNPG